jgi:hypothetical protein
MIYSEFREELLKAIELANNVESERDLSEESKPLDVNGNLSYTENEKAFSDFIISLSEDSAHAIQAVMYIGKDGVADYSGTTDIILSDFMKDLTRDADNWTTASVMLDKAQVATFLIRGKVRLDSM